jgi:DNA helicase-2/ATP-dependent DNA helicase PcrA
VRECVRHLRSGTLNLGATLRLQHLIVDEYQDLNPMDLELVDRLLGTGAHGFVAGDDDQSIYSFRFAAPSGIQEFAARYPGTADHALSDCFRCTPAVLEPAQALIGSNAPAERLAKRHVALYGDAEPPVRGRFHAWRFETDRDEADAIATSAKALIEARVNPREVLVLLCNKKALLPTLKKALNGQSVPWEPPRQEGFLDSNAGRLVLGLLRIVCDPRDYVAHRTLFGLKSGVGIQTCCDFASIVIKRSLNYRDVFYQDLPSDLQGRLRSGWQFARDACALIGEWHRDDAVSSRAVEIGGVVRKLGTGEYANWNAYLSTLPDGITLEELRDLLWADSDEQQVRVLDAVYDRTGARKPPEGVLPPRIRVMTMHGAKGLSAQVVFVPGLEEPLLPGPKRSPYPGLVQESARLLYVSITRARVACIASYSRSRFLYGDQVWPPPSRFASDLGVTFVERHAGLSTVEAQQIHAAVRAL